MDSSRKSTWASIWATRMPWCSTRKEPRNASCKAGILARSRPLASSASCTGSLIPASSASRIARPVVFEQLGDPGRVGHVGLAAGHVVQMLGVEQPDLRNALLEQEV